MAAKQNKAVHSKKSFFTRGTREYGTFYYVLIGVLLGVLLFDQGLKFWVKTHMYYGQTIPMLGDWFLLHFTENEGIAFGLSWGGVWGKVLLSLFRIGAVGVLGWMVVQLYRCCFVPKGILLGLTLILTGALGNVIDGTFYGVLFSSSREYMLTPEGDMVFQLAEFCPSGGGYAPLLQGLVVDMLYFPLVEFTWPSWLPWIGGNHFLFFAPVFNIADSAITVGALYILLFHWRFLMKKH